MKEKIEQLFKMWDELYIQLQIEEYIEVRKVAKKNPDYYKTSSQPEYLLNNL